MKTLRGLLCLSLVLGGMSSGMARGQAPAGSQGLDAGSIAADERLKTHVTLKANRIYLGELLEKLSAQTGVSISIAPTDRSSGTQITCDVRDLPLSDLLNSLWSLVGYSQATWQIAVDAQKTPHYQLLPGAASRSLEERFDREYDRYGEELTALLLKMSTMKLDERRKNKDALVRAMLLEDDATPTLYIEDDRFWAPLNAFVTGLTPEQQKQVRNGETVSLPTSKLDANLRALLSLPNGNTRVPGVPAPAENAPDTVRFSWIRFDVLHKKHATRELWIGVGNARGFAYRDYLVALERPVNDRIYDAWLLPNDQRSTWAEKEVVVQAIRLEKNEEKGVPVQAPIFVPRPRLPFSTFMSLMASAQNASYLGVIPEDADNEREVIPGRQAQEFLMQMWVHDHLMHKWRGNVLLLNYPVWFTGEEAEYPYALVQQLRETRQHNAGSPFTLPQLADRISTLNDPQIRRLAKEFPQAGLGRAQRALLALYQRYPGLLSEAGETPDAKMIALLTETQQMPPLAEKDTLEKLRILEETPSQSNGEKRLYRLQFQTAQRKEWQELTKLSISSDAPASH